MKLVAEIHKQFRDTDKIAIKHGNARNLTQISEIHEKFIPSVHFSNPILNSCSSTGKGFPDNRVALRAVPCILDFLRLRLAALLA